MDAWRKNTWSGMRAEYYNSDEEKVKLPDDDSGSQAQPSPGQNIKLITVFSVKPLKLEDVQGGFFLLGMGITITFIVHLLHILVVKICGIKDKK